VVTALVTAEPNHLSVAYAHCERLARSHYENFPVASYLLPAEMRPHIAAIYAFARTADDFADEPGLDDTDRIRRLDDWRDRLIRLKPESAANRSSVGRQPDTSRQPEPNDDLIFLALAHTIDVKRLSISLFEDLLSAFRQDVTTKRYANWTGVLDYCRRSANPVGRLVLRVAGYDDPRTDAASDALCTALQLTNFWQDSARDWQMGRLYLPIDERDRAGAVDADLDAGRLTPEWKRILETAAVRTRELFDAGRPVCDRVSGRLRWELRLTWLGGMRILEKLRAGDFPVFDRRPTLGASDVPLVCWRALRWGHD
jgi:squalene synthase HpnC